MPEITWVCKKFQELDPVLLYKILRLRCEVFIVEQNCPYLDPDNKDFNSYHLCGWMNEELAAYARLLPPGIAYTEASIGRVSTSLAFRNTGAGRELMLRSIALVQEKFPGAGIKIGAQLYLHRFYSSLGFKQSGPEYLEDGIPHIEMTFTK